MICGETAVIWVSLLTVKLVAAVAPNVTAVAAVKPEPATTTLVPPAVDPLAGFRPVTAGGGVAT